jgi:hypothetical protein
MPRHSAPRHSAGEEESDAESHWRLQQNQHRVRFAVRKQRSIWQRRGMAITRRVVGTYIVHPRLHPRRRNLAGRVVPEAWDSVRACASKFLAVFLTEIYLCNVCSCQELLRHNCVPHHARAGRAAAAHAP